MSVFKVEINTDNAAFENDNCLPEVVRILRQLADKIEKHRFLDGHYLRDVNGNTVGSTSWDAE